MYQKIRHVVHHLRKKPEEERRHILSLLMIGVCIVMVVLWVFSLSRSISNPETKIKVKQDLKPFSVLKSNLIDGFNSASEPTAPANQ